MIHSFLVVIYYLKHSPTPTPTPSNAHNFSSHSQQEAGVGVLDNDPFMTSLSSPIQLHRKYDGFFVSVFFSLHSVMSSFIQKSLLWCQFYRTGIASEYTTTCCYVELVTGEYVTTSFHGVARHYANTCRKFFAFHLRETNSLTLILRFTKQWFIQALQSSNY